MSVRSPSTLTTRAINNSKSLPKWMGVLGPLGSRVHGLPAGGSGRGETFSLSRV